MKQIFSLIACILCSAVMMGQNGYGGDYDPSNPADPQSARPNHNLFLKTEPVNSGYFNICLQSSGVVKYQEGESIDLVSWPYSDFEFVGWKRNDADTLFSTDCSLQFEMPTEDVTLTAVMNYNPQNPPSPNANYWNPATGELIIDEFTPGRLRDAMINLVGDEWESVTQFIVAGIMNVNTDYSYLRRLTNCTYIDLSRTAGYNRLNSNVFRDLSSLKELLLPACVESIRHDAFRGCTGLSVLTCFAQTPPEVDSDSFRDIPEDVTLYVPAVAVEAYKNHEIWSQCFKTILPIQADVNSIQIDLPTECIDGRYKNMTLELVNQVTGQKHIYIINDRITYVYSGLVKNSTFRAYLRNQQGVLLGETDIISLQNEDIVVPFTLGQLKRLYDVKMTVLAPDGEDITSKVQGIQWFDARGNYLSRAESLAGQIEDTELQCSVLLTEEQAMLYRLPETVRFAVDRNSLNQMVVLTAIPKITVSGSVKNAGGETLAGATVVFMQTINGRYSKTVTTLTESDGTYSVEIYNEPTTISVSMYDYITSKVSCDAFDTANLSDIILKLASGARIIPDITFFESTVKGAAIVENFNGAANICYSLYNKSVERQIENFAIQNGRIILTGDEVKTGDQVLVTASSVNSLFDPVSVEITISDIVEARFRIVAHGGVNISKSDSENEADVCMLFNENGTICKICRLENDGLAIDNMADGNYTVVAMAYNQVFNAVQSLSQIAAVGLEEKRDFLKAGFSVASGRISTVSFNRVPSLSAAIKSYIGNATRFEVNKSQVVAGNYLTVKASLDVPANVAAAVEDFRLIVNLPEGSEVTPNSVMLGSTLASYTIDGERNCVEIPMEDCGQIARLCFIPTVEGEHQAIASVAFKLKGMAIVQPIGSVPFTVKSLSITVPSTSYKQTIPVCGTAMGKSAVTVYDNDVIIGTTTALSNGNWSLKAELTSSTAMEEHRIRAVSEKDGLRVQSEVAVCVYDPTAIRVDRVTMINTAHPSTSLNLCDYVTEFNFQDPKYPGTYWYWPSYPDFTFKIEFSQNDTEKVAEEAELLVQTSSGSTVSVPAKWNARHKCWLAVKPFDSYSLPRKVSVVYYIIKDGKKCKERDDFPGEPACDVQDPSGYVYEAVESNRLEGVKATAYFKETVEDAMGDLHEVVSVWDAGEYGQENPLYTDANGMYAWDVPQGLWQVRFEKDGYETVTTEWLPVPPPQMDINIGMRQMVQPQVIEPKAYEDAVEFSFDKYMDAETLCDGDGLSNTIAVFDSKGNRVDGRVTLPDVVEQDGKKLASKVRFEMASGFDDTEIKLTVGRGAESYAGKPTVEFEETFDIVQEVKGVIVNGLENAATVAVEDGATKAVQIGVKPGTAARGQKITVKSASSTICTIAEPAVKLNDEGVAEVDITGALPGVTQLTIAVEGTNVTGTVQVNVVEKIVKPDAPLANRTADAVYHGTGITLKSQSDNVDIFYSLNGAGDEQYNGTPIAITEDVTIAAYAVDKKTSETSDVSTFNYTIRQSRLKNSLESGWNWVSHNVKDGVSPLAVFDGAERIVSQTKELIYDEGFKSYVGNLKSISAAENVKVKMTAAGAVSFSGDAINPEQADIALRFGWNWIGYPVEKIQTLDEAFNKFNPAKEDLILGQDGFAEFDGEAWVGSLQSLVPGQGYLYKSAGANTLNFYESPDSKAQYLHVKGVCLPTPWKAVDVHKYPNRMSMVAVLEDADAADYAIGAFDTDGECRGIAKEIDGKFFLSVCGNGGEEIRFIAMNRESGEETELGGRTKFVADVVGSLGAPYILMMSDPSGIRDIDAGNGDRNAKVYDLTGRRVNVVNKRGIYIRQGRKVMVK